MKSIRHLFLRNTNQRTPNWAALIIALATLSSASCFRYDVQKPENSRPIVSAGEDVATTGGETVTLTGTVADADNDELSIEWTQVQGSPVDMHGSRTTDLSFEAPLNNETMIFSLSANDSITDSDADLIRVEVSYNQKPVANPGDGYETFNLQPIHLRGDGEDPDGDTIISYQWFIELTPSGVESDGLLADADKRYATFTPNGKGEYIVSLIVNDGEFESEAATTWIFAANNPPVAKVTRTPLTTSINTWDLSAATSFDLDGDSITSWAWKIVSLPENASLAFVDGVDNTEEVRVELQGAGTFLLELTVTDSDNAPSDPFVISLDGNRAPILSISDTRAMGIEGETFTGADAAGSVDMDGDDIIIQWHKISGSELFPSHFVGATPTVIAPSFASLSLEGSTLAQYEVWVSDGVLESEKEVVEFYVLPSDTNYVIVTPTGSDIEGCGAVANPCKNLPFALSEVSDENRIGDGRHILLTTGTFATTLDYNDRVVIRWPSGTRLIGGRDPVTFLESAPSLITLVSHPTYGLGYDALLTGIYLDSGITRDVVIENVEITYRALYSANASRTLYCDNCSAHLKNVTLRDAGGVIRSCALYIENAGADMLVENSTLISSDGGRGVTGAKISNGTLTIKNSRIETDAVNPVNNAPLNACLHLNSNATLVGENLELSLFGQEIDTAPHRAATVLIEGGSNLSLKNSFLETSVGSLVSVVRSTGSNVVSLWHNTLLGSGAVQTLEATDAAAIHLEGPATLVGNLISQSTLAVDLSNTDALASAIYGNDFHGTIAARCDGTEVSLQDINSDTSTLCNTSGGTWAGNISALCPLMNASEGNFHLNPALTNPCIDGGMSVSVAGSPPATDIDGESRPDSNGAPDIGADEVH
ncbi:hypothetical protein KAI87_05775 [Myxococcota bacterium]|nr:hypothetical protein [Myxococcota bacterium]